MSYVIQKGDKFIPASGNPTLISLGGTKKASLKTILNPTWSDADRAQFGVFRVEKADVPQGKRVASRTLERQGIKVVERVSLEDAPPSSTRPRDTLKEIEARFAELEARIAALESKQ